MFALRSLHVRQQHVRCTVHTPVGRWSPGAAGLLVPTVNVELERFVMGSAASQRARAVTQRLV